MDHEKIARYFDAKSPSQKEKSTVGFVTISRQAGAGGITIGKKLALRLDKEMAHECPWTVFDKNLVDEVMKDNNLTERMIPFLKEKSIPEIQDTFEDVLRVHPAQFTLVQRTNKTITRLAEMGHAIIVGRGAPVVTKDVPGGVHVRLIGSFKTRKEHIMEYYKFDDQEARDFIKNEDKGRAEYLKKYFDKNIDDPLLYDLVINTDSVSYDAAAGVIAELVVGKVRLGEKSPAKAL
jgi:cytidylate kinase